MNMIHVQERHNRGGKTPVWRLLLEDGAAVLVAVVVAHFPTEPSDTHLAADGDDEVQHVPDEQTDGHAGIQVAPARYQHNRIHRHSGQEDDGADEDAVTVDENSHG